jgi:hypothetical protein
MEVLMAPRSTLALLSGIFLLSSPTAWAQEVPGEGDLVITEIVIAPNSGSREWFEVENVSGAQLELDACLLAEGHYDGEKSWTGHDHTIEGSLIIDPGQRAVLMYGTSSDSDPVCAAYSDEALSDCVVETAYRYRSLGFNNNDAELLSITCGGVLVDEAPLDWGLFSDDCPEEAGSNCSVNLAPDAIDASSNDDLSNWCVPWQADLLWDHAGAAAIGTPGQANLCYEVEPWCGAGEAIISELMIAPPDGYDEWIEIFGAGAEACNLGACQLKAGPSADPSYEPGEKDDWEWDVVELEVPFDTLMLEAGGFALLARSDEWISGDGTGGDDIPADLSYSGISLPNSDAEWLHLVCGETVVDSAPIDWPSLSDYCPEGNCSANLAPEAMDAASNDAIAAWCVPPAEAQVINPSGYPIRATPGEVGSCLSLAWPAEGEVIFTELMASPQGGIPEYMELLNTTSSAVDLSFCELRKQRLGEDGELDPESLKRHLIGSDGGELSMQPSAVQLLAYKECLPLGELDTAAGGDTAGGEEASCSLGEYLYSTIQISADEEEHISLVCPGPDGAELVIDSIALNVSVEGVRDGHAIMLDPDMATAEGNDAASAWCEAAFSQKIDALSDDLEDCNYGTPGSLDPCLVDTPEPLQPVCRCSSQQRPAGWAALALLSLGSLLVARRRERC